MLDVEKYLIENHIEYDEYEHAPVYTCKEAEVVCKGIDGLSCKNLFLTDEKNEHFILAVFPAIKNANLKAIATISNNKRLSFAKPEYLYSLLGLLPGSVSIFGLINDTNGKVDLVIDNDVYSADTVKFHPNRNNATLKLNHFMFIKYIEIISLNRRVWVI